MWLLTNTNRKKSFLVCSSHLPKKFPSENDISVNGVTADTVFVSLTREILRCAPTHRNPSANSRCLMGLFFFITAVDYVKISFLALAKYQRYAYFTLVLQVYKNFTLY